MRDLKADLKLCEAATPGPWEWKGSVLVATQAGDIVLWPAKSVAGAKWEGKRGPLSYEVGPQAWTNAVFIAAAREGWPEAIKRALEAEARLQELWEAADDLLCALRASKITAAALQQEPAVLEACRRLFDVLYNDPSGKGGNAHGT